jgi:hypothetical protein
MGTLSFADGLNRVRREITGRRGLWPTIALRMLAQPRQDSSGQLQVLVANIQPTIVDQHGKLELLLDNPIVLEGVMTEFQFSRLLENWAASEPFQFGEYTLWPPEIHNVTWQEDLTENILWDPLLVPLEPHGSHYLVYRLVGHGVPPIPEDVTNAVNQGAFALGTPEGGWSRDYLGMAWQPHATDVRVHLPIPVSIEAAYDATGKVLSANLFYRGPFKASDFWLRFGDRWIIGLQVERFNGGVPEAEGWYRAEWSRTGVERKPIGIWVGTDEQPNKFRWQATPRSVSTVSTQPHSAEEWKSWRLKFMNLLYDRAGPSTMSAHNTFALAKDLGIPRMEALHVMQYLVDEGLIKPYGAGSEEWAPVVLTHEGIREVEQARDKPATPTKHFPAMNTVVFAGNVSNSQVQVGTIDSQQRGKFISVNESTEIATWVSEVEGRLPEIGLADDDMADVKAQLEAIRAQLRSPRPRHAALAASAGAVKGVLETFAAATTSAPVMVAAAQLLIDHFPRVLGG